VVELILGSRFIFYFRVFYKFVVVVLEKKVTIYVIIHTEPLLRNDDDKKSVLECVIGVN